MDDVKKAEIKAYAESLITEGCDCVAIAKDIMLSYIFGDQVASGKAKYNYGTSEHFTIDELIVLVEEKYYELYPLPEPVVSEGGV